MRWTYLGGILCAAVALFSFRYVVLGLDDKMAPPNVVANPLANPWLLIHAGCAALALLVGPFQFIRKLRQTRPDLHRWIGRTYAAGCTVGGVSGLLLAGGTTAGPIAAAGFGGLAIAWLWTTTIAWRAAWQRDFGSHRKWMIRSFALTCAAVTLRLYLPVAGALPIDFMDGYRAISWLCWVPNLIVVEYFLLRKSAANG